jgi:signal transduction histidine kinase
MGGFERPPWEGRPILRRDDSGPADERYPRAKVAYSHAAHPAPTRADLPLDAAIAVAVFAASLGLLAVGVEHGRGDFDALAVVLTALASLPLVARRRAPLAVFVLTAVASTALRGVAEPAGPPLGATLALYWMVADSDESRSRTRLMAALVPTMLVAHVTAGGLAEDRFPLTESLFGLVVWGGAWLAGDRTRLRHERMAELEERALRAEHEAERERRLAAAEERTRIARDLHDSAGHAINVILVHAGLGRLQTDTDPQAAREAFRTIEEVARETVGEIDELVRVLREDASTQEVREGVEPPPGVAALDGLVERHRAAGLDVTATVRGDVRSLPPGVDRGAYRILQEALTNAARHGAGSATVEVALGRGELDLTIANPLPQDGARTAASGGHGVSGMRERAALLGGSLDAGVLDGHFQVHARLPVVGRRG